MAIKESGNSQKVMRTNLGNSQEKKSGKGQERVRKVYEKYKEKVRKKSGNIQEKIWKKNRRKSGESQEKIWKKSTEARIKKESVNSQKH